MNCRHITIQCPQCNTELDCHVMLADDGSVNPSSEIVDLILNQHNIQVHGQDAATKTS